MKTITAQFKTTNFPITVTDSKGREIYIEEPDGFCSTKMIMKAITLELVVKDFPIEIFDSNNNQIYYEDSDGFWWRKEFDVNDNEIYVENSDGYIEDFRK